ncbi:MAG: Uncharacterized protein FD133_36 [Erysipelotrichaceae bacterium]|nr:MAG: hypothetical protein FD179_273 [Erysipelotrichaceae bacterium]TXT19917.1 MAG: Uncharacterized protein FD133_36 [Erysipelotrichaceae bacterium]
METVMLPVNLINIINITLIALIVILGLIGYLKGFISQAYDLLILGLGIIVGWSISPSLAKEYSLASSSINFNDIPFFGGIIVALIDQIIWTIIIVIVIMIIGFVFKGLLIKKVLRYKHKVLVDRIGGAVFSIIPVFFVALMLALTLSVPVFSNGTTILKATVASPLAPVASSLISGFIEDNPTIELVDKISEGEPLEEEDYVVIENTLQEMGFPEDVTVVALKFVKKEEVTEDDLEVLKNYAEENDITPDQIKSWMKDLGFTDAQIKALMDQYQ